MRLQQVSGQTAIAFLEQLWNRDLSAYDPDGPLPDIDPDPGENTVARGRASVRMYRDPLATAAQWRARAEAENLSIRELIIEVTGRQSFVGSPATVAEQINDFVQADASDGFILVPHITPGGLDEFADTVVPLLQERGVFRADYEGSTLREHLGPRAARDSARSGAVMTAFRSPCLTWCRSAPAPPPRRRCATASTWPRQAERFGYARYWFAEHHLNPGVAGTSPAVVLALTAAATSTIRIGSGAVQMGHRTALSTVEEFGLIDALHPGRLDLGLAARGGPSGRRVSRCGRAAAGATQYVRPAPNGLLIPPRFSPAHLLRTPRFALQSTLLQQPGCRAAGLRRTGR